MKAGERMANVRPKDTYFLWSVRSLLVLAGLLSLSCSAERMARPALAQPAVADPLLLEDFDPQPYRALEGERPAPVGAVFEAAAPAVCRFAAASWNGPVRVSPELEAFVTLASTHTMTVAIPEGDASQGARARLEVLGVRLNALVAARDLEIYLKKPQLLGGYVWAGSGTALRWTGASAERLAYQVVLPARVSPAAAPPSGEQACNGLSVESADDDGALSRAIFAGRKWVLRAHWRGDDRVPLSRAPGQPRLAFLDTRAACADDDCEVSEPVEVLVLERRADWVRVAYALEALTVVGWVPGESVQTQFERLDTDELMLSGALWAEPVEPFGADDPTLARGDAKTLCAWNAPLAAEISGVMRAVGTLASGIPLLAGARRQGWRAVVLEHPALSFTEGARLWVPQNLLYPCRQLP